ncbi:MAG: DUF2490 domain-containing protein [Acidobacteria bacterium]|nr:DUF2490 domain-containing protein [Acidobacteriota bacterium]
MKKNVLALSAVICLCALASVRAQTPDLVGPEDNQSWNDIQVFVPMTAKVDFWAVLTTRFGKNVSRLNDGRFAVGVVIKPNKAWSLQPFYLQINARNTRGKFRIEHRLNLRIGYKFPIKKFGLSHRSLFEYRIRPTGNSWRYRPSLTFEKDLPGKLIPKAKFYVTEEPFYDSSLKRFSRNRLSFGINKTLSNGLSLEIYYLRQNDGISRPGDLNVIGTSFKLKL